MTDLLDLEHQRRSRAEQVVAMLQALWGDELPAGPHPELTVLIDAIAIDDEHATSTRLVSQGDGLTYDLLAALCAGAVRPGSSSPVGQLPPALVHTLRQLNLLPPDLDQQVCEPAPDRSDRQSPPAADDLLRDDLAAAFDAPAVPSAAEVARVGMWEVDPQTRTVAYDAVTAGLMGDEEATGYGGVYDHLNNLVHPADRAHIEHAMQYALRTETTYRVRFRVVSPTGMSTWLISQGRVLRKPSDGGARLTGYLILDRSTNPGAELVELA